MSLGSSIANVVRAHPFVSGAGLGVAGLAAVTAAGGNDHKFGSVSTKLGMKGSDLSSTIAILGGLGAWAAIMKSNVPLSAGFFGVSMAGLGASLIADTINN